MPHDFLINGLAGLHELVGDGIGLNEVSAERHKHFTHYGFACSNSSGQSDFQQSSLISKTNSPQRHRKKTFRFLIFENMEAFARSLKIQSLFSVSLW
jgi:hypothetical protein